jgi:predicted Zn-dependent peptidase
MRGRAALAMCAIALLAYAPAIASPNVTQSAGTLPRGGSYIIQPDATVAAAAIELWFRAPGAGYDDATPGIARLAATAAAAAKLHSGKTLAQFLRSIGGRLTIYVYPDILGVAVIVPAPSARRATAALTAAYFASAIDAGALRLAQRDVTVLSVQKRFSADLRLHDLLLASLFDAGPARSPTIPDATAAITGVSLSDVSRFARRAFRSSNAVLTMTGHVDARLLNAVTEGGGESSMDPAHDSRAAGQSRSLEAVGLAAGIGLGWIGPPIASEREATAMDFVADYLFRENTGTLVRALADAKLDAFVNAQFVTLHDPGVMLITISGKDAVVAQARVTAALQALQSPLGAAEFAAARNAFVYHIQSDTQTAAGHADNLGWYFVEGNPMYAPGDASGTYLRQAESLDPGFVAGAVRRYLQAPTVVHLTVPSPTPSPTGTAT